MTFNVRSGNAEARFCSFHSQPSCLMLQLNSIRIVCKYRSATSVKEVVFSLVSVCLSVNRIKHTQKTTDQMKIYDMVGHTPRTNRLEFESP